MDNDFTIVDYNVIDVYPTEEIPYQYENLKLETNQQIYERHDLRVIEARLTLQFAICNIKQIDINVIKAEKVTIYLYKSDQGILKENERIRKPTLVKNKIYTYDFQPNQSCQCRIEILTQEKEFQIQHIILRSQPLPVIPQIQNAKKQAAGQNQDIERRIPKPQNDLVGSQPVQELNHPPKFEPKDQTKIVNIKDQQKEKNFKQFVKDSSYTPIHIKGQKSQDLDNDKKPIKQLNKNDDLDGAKAVNTRVVVNQKWQIVEKQAQKPKEEEKQFQNFQVKPQDVQVNQYKTQDSRGIALIKNAHKQDELIKKQKQLEQEEAQRQIKDNVQQGKEPQKKNQKLKEPVAKQQVEREEVDPQDMYDLLPSDLCPEIQARINNRVAVKNFKALRGLRFYINQQHLNGEMIEKYRKIITDNGGRIEQEIKINTDFIFSEQIIPGEEIKSSQHYLRFQFLEELKPKVRPQFEKYYIN